MAAVFSSKLIYLIKIVY